ncbi:MAG: adenylosuccinate lyase, partial [Bacteroidetes bacterium]
SFRDIVDENAEIVEKLGVDEIEDAFDPHYHLRNVDEIFERVGLG